MDEARRLLRHHFGHGEFRPAQRPVIASVLAGRDTLAVLPTGGGKSVCFQVPALVAGGLTLVVSPLIALMQDQVAAATARAIPSAALHSAVGAGEREAIWRGLADGSLRLLYVSPERLTRLAPSSRIGPFVPHSSPSTRLTASPSGVTISGQAIGRWAPHAIGWACRRPSP
jgi:ATP-dependent DNA helicase RecQ